MSKPEDEAKRLTQQAQEFLRIGNWLEGVALLEASLLLDPNSEQSRCDVIVALGRWIGTLYRIGNTQDRYALAYSLYCRDLEHLELLSRIPRSKSQFPQPRNPFELIPLDVRWCLSLHHLKVPENCQGMVEDLRKINSEVLLRVGRQRIEAGYPEEGWISFALDTVPPAEHIEFVSSTVEEFGALPGARSLVFRLLGEFRNIHQRPESVDP